MPSSMMFVGLVVLWLLILVPAVARHQQVVARPSVAALSGRVLARPVRSTEEDDVQEETAHAPDDPDADDDQTWERPAPRYRPGRGGYDPEAAELAARARYAVRQRIVLGLLAAAVVTAGLALFVSPAVWWGTGAAVVALAGYLVYLRRQVRMEEAIRARRAARMAGTRRPGAAEDPALDGWARRGQEAAGRPDADDEPVEEWADEDWEGDAGELPDTLDDDPDRIAGCGEPTGPLRDRPGADEPALPRLAPTPPPPPPSGTTLVEADSELDDLDVPVRPGRRAVG